MRRASIVLLGLLIVGAALFFLPHRGWAAPPAATPPPPPRAPADPAAKGPPQDVPAEEFAPMPDPALRQRAAVPQAARIEPAALVAAGLPAAAAADVAAAIADLQQVGEAAAGGPEPMHSQIALLLALVPELPARIADHSIQAVVTPRKARVDAVATSFRRPDHRGFTVTVHCHEHLVRLDVPRSVGPVALWQSLQQDGK